jgi:putative transposase
VCFTTGAMRVEPDRRHLTLPVIGTVRTHENMRRIERLIRGGRARVLAISVRRNGTRIDACVRVLVQRPIQPKVALPDSRGEVLERSPTQRRWARRSKSFGTPAVPARAARKVHDATVSAPPRFPGCIAGSTMSALITCTS